jgi:hypothetical protein
MKPREMTDSDEENLIRKCEELLPQLRTILMGHERLVIMNTVAFVLAESMYNLCEQPNWDKNLEIIFKTIKGHLKSFTEQQKGLVQ